MKQLTPLLLLLLSARCSSAGGAVSYPRAYNVTWTSTNFKTILSWEPKPSSEYAYTVEYSTSGGDMQRNLHCLHSNATECDLSASLTELRSCYTADVLSVPPLGRPSDLTEFPHTTSARFCPYEDTEIGRPDFSLKVHEDRRTTTLTVADPLTALFQNGRQLTIRDVFAEELQYKVTYRRKKSTGQKTQLFSSSVIEMSHLDEGESYCFNVQAHIPRRRRADRQLGQLSLTRCSHTQDQSIFRVYSLPVIAGGVLFVLLVVGLLVTVAVVCWRRRRRAAAKSGAEGVPLRGGA